MTSASKIACSVVLVTHALCRPATGHGAWAAILSSEAHTKEKTVAGSEADTTANRMQLTAVLMGVKALLRPVHLTIISDSRYVTDGIASLATWKSNNWRGAGRKKIANVDLWEALEACITQHSVLAICSDGQTHPSIAKVPEAARQQLTYAA